MSYTTNDFSHDGLATDTSQASIPLDEILDGWPGKDGIPAVDDPKFLSQPDAIDAMNYLDAADEWVVIVGDSEARFYSFDILVWHEIVNDQIDEHKIAVTFCPLCGSSIVYNRVVDGSEVLFGVSGKLYNSNLLMYDDLSESLWSQSIGEAVVWDKTGTSLSLFDSDIMTYEVFQGLYPEGLVLSDDTWEPRSYWRQPYGNYESNDTLYFPVNHEDVRLPRKEILYIVNDGDTSIAFVRADLVATWVAQITIDGNTYEATYKDSNITVVQGDRVLPGYHEMWFSWVTHNQNTKNIWRSSDS